MRRFFHWAASWLLMLALFASAYAETAFVPEAEWAWTAMPLEVEMTADVKTHMPYDETRLQQLNNIIKHMKLQIHLQQLDGEQWSKLSLLVDDTPAVTALLRESPQGAEAQFSSMPHDAYVWDAASGISLETLLGGEKTDVQYDAEMLSWLDDALMLFQAMTEAMPDYVTDKSNTVSIKNMGKATRKQTVSIPKGDAEGLNARLAALCPEGKLRELMGSLTFSGKQTLTLWRNKDGKILRADWSGNAGFSEADMREVSLSWKLRREDDHVRDELILRTPRAKGTGRNNLSIDRVMKRKGSTTTLDVEVITNTIADGVKTIVITEAELEHKAGKQGRLTGSAEVETEVTRGDDSDTERLVVKPDITFTGTADAPALEGTVEVSQYHGKALLEQADISLKARQTDWMLWQLQPGLVTINADNAQQEGERVVKGMTVDLVRRLVLLPPEDTLFLSADLDPAVWEQIVQAAQSALQ